MKPILKSNCPIELAAYLEKHQTSTWGNFKNEDQKGYSIVCNTIKCDQLGICCYCETDFEISDSSHIKDFRVEHFYPKSQTPIPHTQENAHLTWQNLLGCCHGGSMNYIDDDRYTSPNLHCDAIKKENDWTHLILNPLDISEDIKIFTFYTDGTMVVSDQCPISLQELAQSSIDKLNLNEKTYLVEARGKIRETLNAEFNRKMKEEGLSIPQALEALKEELFSDTATNMKFYTCKLDYVSY
ncbi:retron system putative HNH endonuclease [Acinetobacter guillouiae]|uniref:retron system putative HNH endonuclease n=1 Tax=Acinetobacter guillouiae TaxID=106649 RepID=UPI003AF705FA